MAEFAKGVLPPTRQLDGSPLRILIIHTRWNYPIVEALVNGARNTMVTKYGVKPENIVTCSVPGSYELPYAVNTLITRSRGVQRVDAVIPIGVLIKGSTMHFEYISNAVANALMRIGVDTRIPVIFGVLTCLTEDQAFERAGIGRGENKGHNHGEDWGAAAVEMALLPDCPL